MNRIMYDCKITGCSQLEPHINKLLKTGRFGAEALWVSAVFLKANALIQGNRSWIVCDNVEFKLNITCFFCTLHTGIYQCTADAKSPVLFQNADSEFSTVFYLIF